MDFKLTLLLMSLGLIVACTSSDLDSLVVPNEVFLPSEAQLIQNNETSDAPKDTTDANARRLKSVFYDYKANDLADSGIDYEYTQNGLIKQIVYPKSSGTAPNTLNTYTYDENVLTQIIWNRGRNVSEINYQIVDGKTTAKKWTDRNGVQQTTKYEYDTDGKLTRTVGGFLDIEEYCQPEYNKRKSSGKGNLTWSYDEERVVSIVSDAGDVTVLLGYNASHRLASRSITFGCGTGGIEETFTYGENGQIKTFERINNFLSSDHDRARNTVVEYLYNEKDQIASITHALYRPGESTPFFTEGKKYSYNSANELVKIQNIYNGSPSDVLTLTYENGICQEQVFTDPEFIISPTHNALFVDVSPQELRCGYFRQAF